MSQRAAENKIEKINSKTVKRKKKISAKNIDISSISSSKKVKRVKYEDDDLNFDDFDELFFMTNYISVIMKIASNVILKMFVIIQTSIMQIFIVLIVESFDTSIAKFLKNSLIKTIKIDIFKQKMFEIWFDDNQTKLSLSIDSKMISSLLILRNCLQHVFLNHQKMNKTIVKKLLKNFHHKFLKLLKKYEQIDNFSNQHDLTIFLSTLSTKNRDNSYFITQRQHQKQMMTLYQQLIDVAENIKRELC